MSENPRTVALKDLQTMLERMLQNQEQNFIRALETQRESILGEVRNMMKAPSPASQTSRGKEPMVLDSNTPVTQADSATASELERKWAERFQKLERSLKTIKSRDKLIDVDTLALFPEARLPQKFKMPQMDKFDGTTCPKTHLKMYVGALNPLGVTNELLAQLFQQSLTGPALRWFVGMDNAKKTSWDSICNAFNRQYHYNIEVDITRRDLETTKQQHKESFSTFLTRWRAKAAQMINRPTEQEQNDIIIKNLLPVYQTHLQTQYLPDFKALIQTASKVEDLIQSGHIKDKSKFCKGNYFGTSSSPSNQREIAVILPSRSPIQLGKQAFLDLGL